MSEQNFLWSLHFHDYCVNAFGRLPNLAAMESSRKSGINEARQLWLQLMTSRTTMSQTQIGGRGASKTGVLVAKDRETETPVTLKTLDSGRGLAGQSSTRHRTSVRPHSQAPRWASEKCWLKEIFFQTSIEGQVYFSGGMKV